MLEALLSRFQDEPALVSSDKQNTFNGCLAALSRLEDIDKMMGPQASNDDFWPSPDSWEARWRPYVVKDGILTIPVKGVLLSDFPWSAGSWATGYEYIWQAYKRGMEDGNVKGIALLCDSPGGVVAGNFDLVDRMHAFPNKKPIRAFAHESAYSAAYSIASVADKIVVSRTGGVGSIGVVTAHVDLSEAMQKNGVKVTFIHFGKHKVDGNPYEALSDDVKARIQARINELGKVFVSTVARNRGMDEEAVRATEALTYPATEALSIGLADAIGPLDDAVAAFVADLSNNEGETQMANQAPAAVDQAAIENARAEGVAQGQREGAAAERTRISAIIGSEEGMKRPKAALAAALDSEMSAEQADKFLAKLDEEKPAALAPVEEPVDPKANGQKFDEQMSKDTPSVGAEAGDEKASDRASRTASMMGWKTEKQG
ncbi:S49 family peptidase [Ochrobactrum sp. GPK 3]